MLTTQNVVLDFILDGNLLLPYCRFFTPMTKLSLLSSYVCWYENKLIIICHNNFHAKCLFSEWYKNSLNSSNTSVNPEAYLESSRISTMEFLAKIVNEMRFCIPLPEISLKLNHSGHLVLAKFQIFKLILRI